MAIEIIFLFFLAERRACAVDAFLVCNSEWSSAGGDPHQALVSSSLHAPVRIGNSDNDTPQVDTHQHSAKNNETTRGSQAIRGRTSQIDTHWQIVPNIILAANVTDQPLRRIVQGPYGPRLAAAASVC